ncbi:MAG TPA: amidohydrolase family protein [Pyrinomonadaceae bacterium]|nr:amidohydrolase family protein [Pyrinomonadaceae bacterium]
MEKIDLIIENAAQLVTCASGFKAKKGARMLDVGIIENGAVAIAAGKIVGVGERAEIRRNFTSENVVDANGKVVCPAFVECHTHIVFAGNRLDEFERRIKGASYMEIMAAGGGIALTVKQTRAAELRDLIEQSRARLDKLLARGVTTCEVKTGYGLNTETELKMLGAIFKLNKTHAVDLVPTLLAAHAIPLEFKGKEDDYVDLVCGETIRYALQLYGLDKIDYEAIKRKSTESGEGAGIGSRRFSEPEWFSVMRDNPFFIDVFCEENAFNLEQSKKILETGKRYGMKIKAHVDEFTNLGGARMAIELGATSIDHLDTISDEEVDLLAASDTIGVVTPTVNFNFGSAEFADARKMIDKGCAIAVSTDYNPGSAPCPSPAMAMAIACRYQKLLPAEALNAATINAAFAVGLGDKVGSIEIGKYADVLILETNDYREIAYEFGGNLIGKVIKKGKVVVA